jgi:hypothetical protein
MADLHRIRKVTRLPLTDAKAKAPLYPLQVGMPALDSIHDDSITFKPKGARSTYHILRTTETDVYEKTDASRGFAKALQHTKVPAAAAIEAAARKPPSTGDQFGGNDRKAAKLSIATGKPETFSDVSKLIATLPSHDVMAALKIPLGPTSGRVKQEQRNVHVTGFLYAASREADNDFHLVVGRDPKASGPAMYMTMEVSGLPPNNSPAFTAMNAARTAYKKFFGSKLPGAGYDYYSTNPIPVVIEGSLFWDATHSTGQAPGPPSLKPHMPTIWEVHPITSIKLG